MKRDNKESKKIRNPLMKRVGRDFRQDIGKNLAIFVFITAIIAFISGFLVTDNSVKRAYDESFDKYNIEDGNFEVKEELTEELEKQLEAEGISLYKNYYVEKENFSKNLVRIFINRKEVDRASILKGELPEHKGEIAIDRLYAVKNNIEIGKEVEIGGDTYTVTGFVALSDYSALFSDNNDLMFDANRFGVAVVTEEQFEEYSEGKVFYSYSWIFNDKLSGKQKEAKNEDIKYILVNGAEVVSFLPEADNQAIHFTGDDMGSDKAMMEVLLYVMMVILAFVLAVITLSTIDKEASVIGTLRASGYTRAEMLKHYIISPVILTALAAVIGNILGYTVLKQAFVDLYYNSYSLPTYKTLWNGDAFIMTTVIPCIIMLVVNLFVIRYKLKLSPLQFLRRNLKKKEKIKAVKLPGFKFLTRFKMRIIFQNIQGYFMLFVGILFANIIALFGLMMMPLLDHNAEEILDNMKGEYQYILNAPVETEYQGAEKCAVNALINDIKGMHEDEINVYGIFENSKYFDDITLKDSTDSVVVSESILEKYKLKIGDVIKLKSEFSDDKYSFKISGSYYYPQGLAIFVSNTSFYEIFNAPDGFFNMYLSDERLDDIDEKMILTRITSDDMIKVTRQLKDSFGGMIPMLAVFTIGMSVLIIYLLSKVVIEKNSMSISMVKILGYNDREIKRLYVNATGIAAIISGIISLPIAYFAMDALYYMFMKDYSGWVSYYVQPIVFLKVFAITFGSYIVVSFILYRKIRKIPMTEVLKV